MGVIEEVKQRADIVDVISQYVSLTKAGRMFKGLCPFHSEKHPSFYVYPEQQSWHCFGACNTGGDVFSFIMKKQGIDFGEALRILAQRVGITVPSKFEKETEKGEKERLYQINQAAAQYFHHLLLNSPAAEKARDYLDKRGISRNSIVDFQLGFSMNSWEALKQDLMGKGHSERELLTAGLIIQGETGGTHDRFRNKLMFPVFDIRGRATGFGARVLDDSLPKYINSPQTPVFDKSSCLYGINVAGEAIRQENVAVIVEGYMDVITAHQYGLKNVIASMGTSITEKQVNIIKGLRENVILALDSDEAGEEAMLRAIGYENVLGAEIRVVVLPEGKDPDDVIKEDPGVWRNLLAQALPVVDFTFDSVTARLDLSKVRDKSSAVDKLLPIIAEIKDNTRRDHYLTKLSRLAGTSYRNMETALSRVKVNQGRRQKREPGPGAVISSHPFLSSPIEEYCLALLLQHPELKNNDEGLLPEYFENTENREIFIAGQQANEPSLIKDRVDSAIHEHIESLIQRNIPADHIELKYADSVRRLREKWLRNLLSRNAEALAVEKELGGTTAELAKLEEQGIEVSIQLGKVITQRTK